MGWAVLVKCMPANWPNMGWSNFFDHFELKPKIIVGLLFVGQSAQGHWLYFFLKFFIGLSLNFQTNTLSNGWDRLTNQRFLALSPGPTGPCPRKRIIGTYFFAQMDAKFFWFNQMQGGGVIRLFFVHRVTACPLPVQVGEILFYLFLINSPTCLARRGTRRMHKMYKFHFINHHYS